jgi:hypothetical protein
MRCFVLPSFDYCPQPALQALLHLFFWALELWQSPLHVQKLVLDCLINIPHIFTGSTSSIDVPSCSICASLLAAITLFRAACTFGFVFHVTLKISL